MTREKIESQKTHLRTLQEYELDNLQKIEEIVLDAMCSFCRSCGKREIVCTSDGRNDEVVSNKRFNSIADRCEWLLDRIQKLDDNIKKGTFKSNFTRLAGKNSAINATYESVRKFCLELCATRSRNMGCGCHKSFFEYLTGEVHSIQRSLVSHAEGLLDVGYDKPNGYAPTS